jgi:hypothetical protein
LGSLERPMQWLDQELFDTNHNPECGDIGSYVE